MMCNLICKLFGHKPRIVEQRSGTTGKLLGEIVYCTRCKKDGFMQRIKKKHGEIIEYDV